MDINDKKLTKIAKIQLQIGILNGEPWAIKHVLSPDKGLTIISDSQNYEWDIKIMGKDDKEDE